MCLGREEEGERCFFYERLEVETSRRWEEVKWSQTEPYEPSVRLEENNKSIQENRFCGMKNKLKEQDTKPLLNWLSFKRKWRQW